MANSLGPTSTDLTAIGRLILDRLNNNLVAARLVTRGDAAGAQIVGDAVSFPDFTISGGVATRAVGGAATASDMVTTTKVVNFQQRYKGVTADNLSNLFSSVAMWPRAADDLARIVADGVESSILTLWKHIPYEVGEVDGSAAFNATDKILHLSSAKKTLFDNKAPMAPLVGILGTKEAHNLRVLTEMWKVNESGSSDMLRNASLGRIYGIDLYESQLVEDGNLTGTTDLAGAVNGAHAAGVTSIAVNALGTGTVNAGTVFTIATIAGSYVVDTNATISGNAATLSFWPPLKAAAAGSEVVTLSPLGEHITSAGSQNLIFHPDAFRLLFLPPFPFDAGSGVASETVSDADTGLSIRLTRESHVLGNPGFTQSLIVDLTWGVEIVRPELAVRLVGD